MYIFPLAPDVVTPCHMQDPTEAPPAKRLKSEEGSENGNEEGREGREGSGDKEGQEDREGKDDGGQFTSSPKDGSR